MSFSKELIETATGYLELGLFEDIWETVVY